MVKSTSIPDTVLTQSPSKRPLSGVKLFPSMSTTQKKARKSYECEKKSVNICTSDPLKPSSPYSKDAHGNLYDLDAIVQEAYFGEKKDIEIPADEFKSAAFNFIKKIMWTDMELHRCLKYNQFYKFYVGTPKQQTAEIPSNVVCTESNRPRILIKEDRLVHWLHLLAVKRKFNANEVFAKVKATSTQWDQVKQLKARVPEAFIKFYMHCNRMSNFSDRLEFYKELREAESPIKRFVALDIEAYEFNHQRLTELGICTFDRATGDTNHRHIIIGENQKYVNHKHCKNARLKFAYGESQVLKQDDAFAVLLKELSVPGSVLIGHAVKSDISFLVNCKIAKDGKAFNEEFLNSIPKYDVQQLHKTIWGYGSEQRLETVVNDIDLPRTAFHNAGNDAALTMAALLALLRITSPLDRIFIRSLPEIK